MTTAMASAIAGSSQYQPPVARMMPASCCHSCCCGGVGYGVEEDGSDGEVPLLLAALIALVAVEDERG